MTSLSIKWRISLWISAVLIAVIAIISTVAYNEFEESHLRNIDQTLEAMAQGIASSLDSGISGKFAEEVNNVTGIAEGDTSTLFRVWWEGSSEDLLTNNTPDSQHWQWLHNTSDLNRPLINGSSFSNIDVPHNEHRIIWLRHKVNGEIANILVASPSHFTYHERHEFLRLLIVLGGSLIIGSIIATMWTIRCSLLPINITAKRLQNITHPNNGEINFNYRKAPKELRPFIEALNEMLNRLDRVLQQQKQFTSDAAHELRTPLSLAKSTLQAAQLKARQPDEYRQTIHDSLEDVARMEYLIEQLLVLARLDEAERDAATSEVELDVLLGELSETYGKRMERSGGKVIFEKSPNITIQGNLDELIRLFSNVLDNAVKYGPPDGTIRISLKQEPDEYVKVYIHDEGGNIPSDVLPHLFERFYRTDPSRSKKTGGAGLGLAIAREIVRRHKGDISITSSPDSGTLVCIKLALS